jgi:hypothetical protein
MGGISRFTGLRELEVMQQGLKAIEGLQAMGSLEK